MGSMDKLVYVLGPQIGRSRKRLNSGQLYEDRKHGEVFSGNIAQIKVDRGPKHLKCLLH